MTRRNLLFLIAALVPISGTGCIVVGIGNWSLGGTRAWTEPVTGKLPIDTANLQALEVRTHNGSISFEAQPENAGEAYVVYTKKAGGRTSAAAEEALEALDVFVEPKGDGTLGIGWRWKGVRHINWGARVSFEIHAPGTVRFDARTHNGSVAVDGVVGDAHVVTHNGPVHVESADGRLYAQTHNGKVEATYAGNDITLKTHNGRIVADLSHCAAVGGSINTHNGSVQIFVSEDTSSRLACRTHNGSVRCDAPLNNRNKTRRRLTGTLGNGDGNLNVTTHNGSVRIKKSTG